jgi:hypothetical protein
MAAMAIMENILRAETEEELFERQNAGTISSKDFTLRPFRLLPENIDWKKSNPGYVEQGGFPYYVLLRAVTMDDGADVVLDSGSPSVLSILEKLVEFDSEDRPIEKRAFERFREDGGRPLQFVEKPVASGYSVIMLMPVTVVESKSKRGRN